ncbi:MAG: hypothetical protein FWF06_07060, partial [Symbiobacteriaceae bacterium]|nr:hypothetical protein [Symbiobacteriaceae bacterium]
GAIGINVSTYMWDLIIPVEVEVDAANIGGSSAGLMLTLEIMDQIDARDLTHGKLIAGSGTIDIEGRVGAIGGVRQKVMGAIASGADYFLIASSNYADAVAAAGNKIVVVEIANLLDALNFLEELG